MTDQKTKKETPALHEKNETTENFPVAQMLAKKYRDHVMAYYVFARAADDIGDDPLLGEEEKIHQLTAFGEALMDPSNDTIKEVIPLRKTILETHVSPRHALDLLEAFKQDAVKHRYENFAELLDYCRYSAAPVGRFLLELHGVPEEAWEASDALCNALQILNHIQDCGDDYEELDRVYIPLNLMRKHSCDPSHLSMEREKASPELRACLDELLEMTQPLIEKARLLPPQVADTHLKIDSSVIVVIAEKLAKMLLKRDPLCDNVKLSKASKIGAVITGIVRAYL